MIDALASSPVGHLVPTIDGQLRWTRDLYYDQLFHVSETGDWESWLDYFLQGAAEQAHDALLRSRRARELLDSYRLLLQGRRESGNALRLLDELFAHPYMTAPWAAHLLDISSPAGARGILQRLVDAGIVEEYPDQWPLFAHPYMTAPWAAHLLDITPAGARGILQRLVDAGIVEEYPDQWPRLYVARELLGMIEAPIAAE